MRSSQRLLDHLCSQQGLARLGPRSDLPPTLEALVASRIDRLPAGVARLVRTVAVIGASCTVADAAAITEITSQQIRAIAEQSDGTLVLDGERPQVPRRGDPHRRSSRGRSRTTSRRARACRAPTRTDRCAIAGARGRSLVRGGRRRRNACDGPNWQAKRRSVRAPALRRRTTSSGRCWPRNVCTGPTPRSWASPNASPRLPTRPGGPISKRGPCSRPLQRRRHRVPPRG